MAGGIGVYSKGGKGDVSKHALSSFSYARSPTLVFLFFFFFYPLFLSPFFFPPLESRAKACSQEGAVHTCMSASQHTPARRTMLCLSHLLSFPPLLHLEKESSRALWTCSFFIRDEATQSDQAGCPFCNSGLAIFFFKQNWSQCLEDRQGKDQEVVYFSNTGWGYMDMTRSYISSMV